MIFKKKVGGGVPFARKMAYEYDGVKYEADIKDGDIVTILDSGSVEIGQFGEQYNLKIKTRNGDKRVTLNQNTINVLVDEFGEDAENWIDKEVKVLTKKAVIAGKKVIIVYLVSGEWFLDEYGELIRPTIDSEFPEIDIDM